MKKKAKKMKKVLIAAWPDNTADLRGGACSHDLECKWAKSNKRSNYVKVFKHLIPEDVPRCSFCGGGR